MPEIVDAYRGAAEDSGREPGEIVLQTGFSWGEDDDAALEGARVWKGEQFSDDDLRQSLIVSSDPEQHVERVREIEEMGATTVAPMNNSGADPHAAIELYGREVLPRLSRSLSRS